MNFRLYENGFEKKLVFLNVHQHRVHPIASMLFVELIYEMLEHES